VSQFIEFFSRYLRNEITSALAAAPGRDLRVFFSGPPSDVLDGIFSSLLDGNEFLLIDRKPIPVFVLDKNAQDPERLRSARCSASHLVKVRTSACRVYLVLMPMDELTNVSIDTTTTPVGTKNSAPDVETWMENAMVRQLVDGALSRFFSGRPPEGAKQALVYAMREAWELDEPHKDRRNTWRILRRLYDCQPQGPVNEEVFLAILGLPKCESDDLGTDEHLKILGRIADLLDGSGLNPGFEMLEEQADDESRPHVAEFRRHVISLCRMPADFSSAPTQKYTPIKDCAQTEIPSWWKALNLATWDRLLDSPPEKVTQPGLKVDFLEAITPDVRGLPVLLQDKVLVKVTIPEGKPPVSVSIKSASGARQLENKGSIDVASGKPIEWDDSEIPAHDRYVRYELEAVGYKRGIIKCIVLDQYAPGVAIYSRNATKITPFKLNRKAKDAHGRRIERYECELTLHGMGSHQLDFYKGSQVALGHNIVGYDVTSEQDGVLERAINPTNDTHAVCVIETDEECYYDFTAKPAGAEDSMPYRILITTEDQTPTGAASQFDRLLIEHRASANGDSVNARVELTTSRATDFEIWAIEGEDSFHPVVFGPDYLTAWKKPAWAGRPILSRHRLMLDPRPPTTEFVPPPALVAARNRIRQFLRPNPDEVTNAIEMVQLADLMANEDFANAVTDYLGNYVAWLQSDYETAAWMDVISIHGVETNGDSLAPIPTAILLTPLHPLRLAWQCQAQDILKKALDRHARCPGASVLDPCSFPDSVLLPCRSATGRIERHGFLSLASSSDYWSILWNKDSVPSLGGTAVEKIFNYEFGILIEGLSTGFSVQQVMRSIEEVGRLSSAKSTLRVSIESDTSGSSSCNEGIEKWCSNNLGSDGDAWFEAGPRSLHVYDHRPEPLQPEQASLASLTAKSGATVRWFTPATDQDRLKGDLAIVAHLGVASPGFQVEGLRAGVDPEALTRYRLRKQLPANGGMFIAESRAGAIPRTADAMTLKGLMLACVDKFETTCAEAFDSYVFAPKMPTLESALDTARYCAVSSSTIDAACFFRATNGSFLWDYELPAYSRRAGENNGYYLLAKESPSIVEAVHTAVHKIAPDAKLEPAQISSLLQEISRRGMPTLKRLTGGGTTSLGEIGMLVALRVLQSEFQANPVEPGLCPVRAGDNILNLLIPADPFKNHFEDLQSAIYHRPGERPDLIVASIRILAGKPAALKLTPMEVKARSDGFAQGDRLAALSQASSFSEFLVQIQSRAQDTAIWSIAWRNLLASWLDYAFRVYGQLESFMRQREWTELHGQVLQGLMSGEIDVEIDMRGRLIVIDHSNTSLPWDVDNDRFNETVVLTHPDAYSLLSGKNNDLLARMRAILGDWSLPPSEQRQDSATPPLSSQQIPLASSTMAVQPMHDAPATPPTTLSPVQTQPVAPSPHVPPASLPVQASAAEPQTQVSPAQAEVPAGIKFTVGSTVGTFQARDLAFFPGNTELNQLNIGIVGDLGTGKTQLIQSLLYQLRAKPENNRGERPKILIFDYKKDYSKRQFVEATGARVVSPFDIPLNIFDTRDSLTQRNAWLERSKFFADVLDKIYSGIGPLQRTRIKEAVRQSYERAATAGLGSPTIYDVFDSYAAICDGQVDTPYSIMSDLVDGGYFERNPQKIQKFSDFLDGIVVVDLGSVGQDDRTKNMLVIVFLNLFYEHMLKIEKKPFLGQNPRLRYVDTMLLVDEADNIMQYEFEVLKRILLQGREFGVGVVLASQYLSHFKTAHENYGEPLLTWFIHKVPNITVRELEGIGLTRVDAGLVDRIKTQACHECLYKTFDVGGEFVRAKPFYELMENPPA
jgi:hypothetical protein